MKQIFTFLVISVGLMIPVWGFAQNHADCDSAYQVCDKNRIHFTGVAGEGVDKSEAYCWCFRNGELYGNPEKNSVWLRFEIKEGGSLSFIIIPDTLSDDIDFVVFALPYKGNCARKKEIRCMAAGDNPKNYSTSPCMGATGLNEFEKDESENSGCADRGDNNWLAPLKVKPGEQYLLLVSNVTAAYNGFKILFGGTAIFACEAKKE